MLDSNLNYDLCFKLKLINSTLNCNYQHYQHRGGCNQMYTYVECNSRISWRIVEEKEMEHREQLKHRWINGVQGCHGDKGWYRGVKIKVWVLRWVGEVDPSKNSGHPPEFLRRDDSFGPMVLFKNFVFSSCHRKSWRLLCPLQSCFFFSVRKVKLTQSHVTLSCVPVFLFCVLCGWLAYKSSWYYQTLGMLFNCVTLLWFVL